MLAELRICDFAIIDQLELRFCPGFSVLTGETGAGKSIIVDALEMLLGGRADSTVIRAGADRALVEGVFRLEPGRWATLAPLLAAEGLESDEPGVLLVAREVRLGGRNVCRVNGRTVTLALLQRITQGLVDIHGQSEHLSLLHTREQLHLLDRYAGTEALSAEVADLVRRIRALQRELEELRAREQERTHRADFLQFQVSEIDAAALQPEEEEELLAERVRLANAEQLATLTNEALAMLEENVDERPAALDLLGAALRTLETLARIDATLAPQAQSVEGIVDQLGELARALHDYREQIEYNPRRLQAVEERLALIRRLERKYGPTIRDVLAYRDRAVRELHAITHSEERIAELEAQIAHLREELAARAWALSEARRHAAQQLAAGVEQELAELRMEKARFGVRFEWRPAPEGVPLPTGLSSFHICVTSTGTEVLPEPPAPDEQSHCVAFDTSGVDHIEFVISPNPGEPLKPIAKIASGGETSRLMLALKTVLSLADETPTLVFDEIDQGIGGRIGSTVGEKLWRLTLGSEPGTPGHQVLCVTHLPQLAGFADQHLHVVKVISGERTTTHVRELQGNERVAELAEMLGATGEAGQRNAQEILEHVSAIKQQRRAPGA